MAETWVVIRKIPVPGNFQRTGHLVLFDYLT